MKRINKIPMYLSISTIVLLQAACSKQAPESPATAANGAQANMAADSKSMAMPMPQTPQGSMDMSKVHQASGVVKGMDALAGTVTLAHGPVASMNWPAMTMAFKVQDKALMDKLAEDKRVDVEFMQMGSDYVVTAVK
jgi:Cu(I)/Ag(I) efflux system protein CusF